MVPAQGFEVFRCSSCAAPFRDQGWLSGNTFGGFMWSDLWLEAPMLPRSAPAAFCPACDAVLWMPDLEPIGWVDDEERLLDRDADALTVENPEWIRAPRLEHLHTDGAFRAAEVLAREGKREAEREMQMWCFWRINDAFRDEDVPWVPLPRRSAAYAGAMERLASLLDDRKREQRLMLAELHRESERYGECVDVLTSGGRRTRLRREEAHIRRLAMAGDSRVAVLDRPRSRR